MTLPRFGRQVAVEVGDPSTVRRFEGLRITFDIQYQAANNPLQGSIDIYNLAEGTAQHIRQRGEQVRLFAGYEELITLMEGDIRRIERMQVGQERITRAHVGGNVRTTSQAVFNRGYEDRVQLVVIIFDLLATMPGLSVGSVEAVPRGVFLQGRTWSGDSAVILTGLLAGYGLRWYEHNGLIYVVEKETGAPPASEDVVISEQTGMVGSPTITDDGIEVTTLLNGRLRLGDVFSVDSLLLGSAERGPYSIIGLSHRGDSHEGDFQTIIEGRPHA